MPDEAQELDPEFQARILVAKHAAEHVADATERLVFDMLMEGGITADMISPSMGLGVMVGPACLIKSAKAHALKTTGLKSIQQMTVRTDPRPSRSSECKN